MKKFDSFKMGKGTEFTNKFAMYGTAADSLQHCMTNKPQSYASQKNQANYIKSGLNKCTYCAVV